MAPCQRSGQRTRFEESHSLSAPEDHLADLLVRSVVTAGASRQVVCSVVATIWRLVLSSPEDDAVTQSLGARLRALEPVLRAQEHAARSGYPHHSAKGLVPHSQRLRANAARHIFGPDFGDLSEREMRQLQRGTRPCGLEQDLLQSQDPWATV